MGFILPVPFFHCVVLSAPSDDQSMQNLQPRVDVLYRVPVIQVNNFSFQVNKMVLGYMVYTIDCFNDAVVKRLLPMP